MTPQRTPSSSKVVSLSPARKEELSFAGEHLIINVSPYLDNPVFSLSFPYERDADGTVKSVDLVTRSTRTVVIEGRQGKLTAERTVPEYLEAPLTASTPVGSVSYRNEAGEVVAEVPLFPACDVEAFALLDILMRILAIYLA